MVDCPERILFAMNGYAAIVEGAGDIWDEDDMTKFYVNIPMRHGWFDVLEDLSFRYPIACAKHALLVGHLKYFRYLMEQFGVDPTRMQPFGHAYIADQFEKPEAGPLYYVCTFGDLKLAKYLVNRGCQVDSFCVRAAVAYGHINIVKYFLEIARHLFSKDLIDCAAGEGKMPIAVLLHEELGYRNKGLDDAFLSGNVQMFRWILQQGKLFVNKLSTWLIREVLAKRDFAMIKALMDSGYSRWTSDVLDSVAYSGNLKLVKRLHHSVGTGFTSQGIVNAASVGSLEIVRYIYKNSGACLTNEAVDAASAQGYLSVVKFLVSNMNCTISSDAADIAAKNGYFAIVRYLIASADAPFTSAALVSAARYGKFDIWNMLLRKTPTIDLRDILDEALCAACENDHLPFVKFLMEEYPTTYLSSCLPAAIMNGNVELITFLANKIENWNNCLFNVVCTGNLSLFRFVLDIIHEKKAHSSHNTPSQNSVDNETESAVVDGCIGYRKADYLMLRFDISSALDIAIEEGLTDTVKFIYHDIIPHKYMPADTLIQAACHGYLDLVEFLVDNGAELSIPKAFVSACEVGMLEIVKCLWEKRKSACDVDAGLLSACIRCHPSIIEYILPFAGSDGLRLALLHAKQTKGLSKFIQNKLKRSSNV
jgi:hypothetical protein